MVMESILAFPSLMYEICKMIQNHCPHSFYLPTDEKGGRPDLSAHLHIRDEAKVWSLSERAVKISVLFSG